MPSEALESFVKCYYTIENEEGSVIEDRAFATGCLEVMFTLHGSLWQTRINHEFNDTSPAGLWGQILDPLSFRIQGRSIGFGIRFLSSSAAFLLRENINQFNNEVVDLISVLGNPIKDLHTRLQEARSVQQQIEYVESYLIKRLESHPKTIRKINLVRDVMHEITRKDFFDNIENVASRYGISARQLQKLFVQHTGLTPKLYSRVNRFQNSLVLVGKGIYSLTAVAYECGYFDQSHFIRDFKSFTGNLPSKAKLQGSTAALASPNK